MKKKKHEEPNSFFSLETGLVEKEPFKEQHDTFGNSINVRIEDKTSSTTSVELKDII